ncbi:MAG: 2Fe-2S iron-sulfur cluster-binding protein [Desulfobacterales bacterium]|nr:2Fe-2S iron-sulfur cluster-binding protein [Desulfobacterales bacterium]
MPDLATVKVFRYDPSRDTQARYETFEGVPYRDRSVLEVIHLICEERDPTIAFREGCDNGTCTGCAMVVNGEPVLACQQAAEKEMVIEPHPKFKIIKDLVIDFDELRERPEI